MTLFNELIDHMKKNYKSNFHVDREDWRTREVLRSLCKLIERRLDLLKPVYFTPESEEEDL